MRQKSLLAIAVLVIVGGVAFVMWRFDAINASPETASAQTNPLIADSESPVEHDTRTEVAANQSMVSAHPSSRSDPARTEPPVAANYFQAEPGKTLTITNLAVEFSALAARAGNGDIIAARTLFRGLTTCQGAPLSDRALKRFEDKVENPDYLFYGTEEGRQNLERARSQYRHCNGLTRDQINSKPRWSAQLAEAGDSQARLEYMYLNAPTDIDMKGYPERVEAFRNRAMGYLNAEIESGNPQGLLAMANSHMPSVVQGQSSAFAPDPAVAYANYYAYGLTSNPQIDVAGLLARLETELTPEQIQQARSSGTAIFEHCCH
jgi:hypothetical protein